MSGDVSDPNGTIWPTKTHSYRGCSFLRDVSVVEFAWDKSILTEHGWFALRGVGSDIAADKWVNTYYTVGKKLRAYGQFPECSPRAMYVPPCEDIQ